ncbi:MAG: glucose/galactose MFS transporter [Chitinophagaceae bacterium]
MSTQTATLPETQSNRYGKKIVLIGAFFFIFGFVTWINGTLIPYLRIACELEEWQAYLVTSAFYISYTIMAIPSSSILQKTGMVKGMSIGLATMAVGCIVFIPAAYMRFYPLFLLGLFIIGIGLTLLQTAVNPYITLLGPAESAARRMSIMGICNKTAGILAPLIMGSIILKNSDTLLSELERLPYEQKIIRLNELSHAVIVPYCLIAALLLLIAYSIRFAHLPEIQPEPSSKTSSGGETSSRQVMKQFELGFLAIFCAVGTEVLAGDSIGNYGLYHGMKLSVAKNLTSWTMACMMCGYLFGVIAIPKIISQQRAFWYSNVLAFVTTILIVLLPGTASIVALALLGFFNALLWPAIWPQALKGLQGTLLNKGSAVLIMGILGGALVPPLYGGLAKYINNQYAYLILIPVYLYLLYYSWLGVKEAKAATIAEPAIQG